MNDSLLTVFVGLTALAIVIQMGVLIALYVSSRKATERLQTIAKQLEENMLPLIRDSRSLLAEATPKARLIIDNLTATSTTVRQDAEKFSSTANELTDRVRQQVLRADQLLTRTLNRVEDTTQTVHHVVTSPMRQVSGVMTGVAAGIAEFLGSRKARRQKNTAPGDEMFI